MLVNNTEKKTHRIGNHQTRMLLRIRRKKYIHKYIETAVIGMNWYLCEINRKFPSHSVSTTSALGSRFIAANECRSMCVCRRVSVGLCMVPTQSAFHDNMHTKWHTTCYRPAKIHYLVHKCLAYVGPSCMVDEIHSDTTITVAFLIILRSLFVAVVCA